MRAVHFVSVEVGELEEGQRGAVGHFEKGMAVVDLAAEGGVEGAFAPGGGEGDAEDVLDEGAVGFLVADREGVVVEALGWVGEEVSVGGHGGWGGVLGHGVSSELDACRFDRLRGLSCKLRLYRTTLFERLQ